MESMDVMRDVKSMSYVELKKYAKELGIELEDAKKVKKEGLIEKIKSHFEQKVMESVRQQAAESEEKPKTRKKKVLKRQAAVEEIIEEPVVVEEPVPVKKSSRRKEKSAEQVVEEAPVQEKTKVVKKKTKKSAPTIESVEEPVQAEITPAKEKKTKKVTKKKSKKSTEEVVDVQPQVEQQVEAPSSTKKVRKVKKVKKTTPTKKTKKTKSTRGAVVEPVVEHSPESNIEPLVLTNSPEPVVVTTQQVPVPIAYEIIVQTPRPSRQSVAKLNNSAKQISKSASKTNNKSTRSSNRLSKSFNASLLTNDDEEENREADITNDVQNTTFDKPSASQPVVEQLKPSLLASVVNSAKKVLACSSFYLTSATNNSPFKIPPIANEPVSVTSPKIVAVQDKQEPPKVVPIVEPIAEASQAQQPAPTDPAKRMGGARIVKPTQTVLIKTTIVKENNVVVEQLREEKVEAVRREAGGPRIVKPVEEKIETKKTKISDAAANDRAKKIKSTTNEVISRIPNSKSTNDIAKKPAIKPVPDFKAIHNKEANKFESIDSWADRVQNRHMNINEAMKKKLTPAKKQPETKSTPSVVVSSAPVELTSNKDSKIPLVKKPVVAQSAAKLPSTPNFNESKVDMGRAPFMSTPNNRAPTTPQLTGPKNDAKLTLSTVKKQQQQPKTPASASRPKPQFNQLLKVAVTNNASQASQTSVATAETNKPVLQAPPTGSFQRRKSFDLTASLSKPLKYKQYTGKLKPVDFNAKSTFLNNLAQAGGGDKTMLKMNTTGNKPTVNTSSINVLKSITNDNKSGTTPGKKPVIGSSIKSSVSGLRTDKNEMSGNAKAEKLNINLEKSRSLIKKAKTEQTSQIRQQQIDSTRNIENQAVKSN